MKVRYGFVSNSSSSSFVVAFPKDFDISAKNIRDYLFAGFPDVLNPWSFGDGASIIDISEILARDMQRQRERKMGVRELGKYEEPDDVTIAKFMAEFFDGPDDEWQYASLNQRYLDYLSEKYAEDMKEFITNLHSIVAKDIQRDDFDLFHFSYSDCTTVGSVMEHGDIFRNAIKSWCQSNH